MRLSRLQKTILLLAIENSSRREKPITHHIPPMCTFIANRIKMTEVTPADVKAAYYGFPLRKKGKLCFCVKEIGFIRYRNAGVAISRSFAALAKRGLVMRHYYGISITELGRQVILSKLSND